MSTQNEKDAAKAVTKIVSDIVSTSNTSMAGVIGKVNSNDLQGAADDLAVIVKSLGNLQAKASEAHRFLTNAAN